MRLKSLPVLGYPRFIGTGSRSAYPFNAVFTGGAREVTGDNIRAGDVDGLVIWGGADISPSLYNEDVAPQTGATELLSSRDEAEREVFQAAVEVGIPIIGVCRGAQLVCALSGGKLVQDVDNHHGNHTMITDKGDQIVTTSIHHQMMFPFKLSEEEYRLLAWSEEKRSGLYIMNSTETMMDIPVEPEVIYFRKTRALAIQGHPEFADRHSPFVQYSVNLARQLLEGTLR
jgi:GMP synthase-like glutamine amidotransferase